jgi:hypothetical protein
VDAGLHRANRKQEFLQLFHYELLGNPRHSPQLAPSAFHFLGPLKRYNEEVGKTLVNGFECRRPISTATENVNSCQDEENTSIKSGIVLKNDCISEEKN